MCVRHDDRSPTTKNLRQRPAAEGLVFIGWRCHRAITANTLRPGGLYDDRAHRLVACCRGAPAGRRSLRFVRATPPCRASRYPAPGARRHPRMARASSLEREGWAPGAAAPATPSVASRRRGSSGRTCSYPRRPAGLRGEERMGGGVSRAGDAFGDVARDGTMSVSSQQPSRAAGWTKLEPGVKKRARRGVART